MCNFVAEFDYHDYSSIIIYLHWKTDDILQSFYSSIRSNSTLKYVTKTLITDRSYDVLDDYFTWDLYSCKKKRNQHLLKHMAKIENNFSSSQDKLVKDPLIDNLIVITYIQFGDRDDFNFGPDVQDIVKYSEKSIQEQAELTVKDMHIIPGLWPFACILTTTSAENYLFQINPAILIIINHESFLKRDLELDFRIGSRKDIAALQREFRSKKITFYTIIDGSLEDVQAIMQKVRTFDFKGLKYMYLVIMSHGDEGDIIYTKTESYNLRDVIVQPLLENKTLANAQKFIIVNACRGNFDPNYDDSKLLEEIQKKSNDSIIYPQDEKLMMIFSTQKGCISLRFDEGGSVFVQEFSKIFGMDFYEKSMESICQETMQQINPDYQTPEFQISDDRPHIIRMEFGNFYSNQELFQDMTDFFKTQFQNNSIDCHSHSKRNVVGCGYVDGSLNDMQKVKMEHRLTSEYSKKVNENCQDSVLKYQWSNEERTGCSRVLATIDRRFGKKRTCDSDSRRQSP